MSNNEKDRFGSKLHDLEKAREDLYFAEQEKAQIAKLRARKEQEAQQIENRCPSCGTGLQSVEQAAAFPILYCSSGHGVWLQVRDLRDLAGNAGAAELKQLADRLSQP